MPGEPGTEENPVACGALDDPIHKPKAASIRGVIYENMVYNLDEVLLRKRYEGCTCPHTGIEGGFFPYLDDQGGEVNLHPRDHLSQ